jgi:hypothetical protein
MQVTFHFVPDDFDVCNLPKPFAVSVFDMRNLFRPHSNELTRGSVNGYGVLSTNYKSSMFGISLEGEKISNTATITITITE